jgi:putative DNA primase/helicase
MPTITMQERLRGLVQGAGPIPPEAALNFLLADMQEDPIPDLGTSKGQAALERDWGEHPDFLVLDNLSCLAGAAKDNEADSWSPLQAWLLSLRRRGVTVLIVHHAGKGGQQRGTSRREDVLDTVISLRRPSDYSPKDGARFEVHLEKARGVAGAEAEPFEARLQASERGEPMWVWEELKDSLLKRAALLFTEGNTVNEVAEELGVSRSASGRLRKRAIAEGLLAS